MGNIDFTRVNNDINGNPRHVVHFLSFIKKDENGELNDLYTIALKRSRELGGKKFHNKQYGGGIVFQMYESEKPKFTERINQIKNR